MKGKIIALIIIITVTVTSVIALNAYAAHYSAVQNEKSVPEFTYTVKQYENHIALYKNEKLLEIFDTVNYNDLPEYDKNQLKKGMGFNSMEDVYKIIEDFDG